MNKLIQRSFLNVLGTAAYITLITQLMNQAQKLAIEDDKTFAPILFLMLFVFSATITGSLIMGKPLLMFLSGEKSEAIKLFLYTLGWMGVAIIILIMVNLN